MIESTHSKPQILLLYDGDCPLCRAYTRQLRIRQSIGNLELVDARQKSHLREQATQAGLDLDKGFVLWIDKQRYYGQEALHRLALISSRHNWFNKLNYFLFRSPRLSRLAYPVLRTGRNLLLRVLGKEKIDNLQI